MSFLEELTPVKIIVLIAGVAVMAAIIALNAIFTFSYGNDVIGPFLLLKQTGPETSALLSGVVSVLFYDVAYLVGFATLLTACQSVWQYGIMGIQFAVCLFLSILASVTSILLISPLGEYVPESMLLIARYAGYGGLIIGFIVNALAGLGYIATNPEMAKLIRQSIRQAGDIATQSRMVNEMDRESRKLAKERIAQEIPFLAEIHAGEAREQYLLSLGLEPELYSRMKRKMMATPTPSGAQLQTEPLHDYEDTIYTPPPQGNGVPNASRPSLTQK